MSQLVCEPVIRVWLAEDQTLDIALPNVPLDPALRVGASWLRGAPTFAGRSHERSGFNLEVRPSETPDESIVSILGVLARNVDFFRGLRSAGAEVVVDIPLFPDARVPAVFLSVGASALTTFAEHGIELRVSCFASSDEDEDE